MLEHQHQLSMKKVRLAVVFPFVLGIFIGTLITAFLTTAIQSIDVDDPDVHVSIQGKMMNVHMEKGPQAYPGIHGRPKDHKRKIYPSRMVSYNVFVSKGELLRRAYAIQKTWGSGERSNEKGRVMFYVEPKDQHSFYPAQLRKQLSKISMVNIPEIGKNENWNPVIDTPVFKLWRDVCQHKLERNLWFASVQDNTYVRNDKLEELLSTLNSSEALFIGNPVVPSGKASEDLGLRKGENYCHKSFYVLSWRALELVCPMLMSCQENARSTDGDVELARCVRIHAGISCTAASEMKELFYSAQTSMEQEDLQSGGQVMRNNKVISMSPLTRPDHFYHIHQYYTKMLVETTSKRIARERAQMFHTADRVAQLDTFIPASEQSFPQWTRVGISPPYQPTDPDQEVIHFQEMDTRRVYTESLHLPSRPISIIELKDIQEVTDAAISYHVTHGLISNTSNMSFDSVLKRTDTQRGVDYFLQMVEKDSNGLTNTKFLHGFRGLLPAKVTSFNPADYKSTKVNFVVASTFASHGFQRFMLSFENSFLSRVPPEAVALLVIVYGDGKLREYTKDVFAVSTLVNLYKKKYPKADLRMVSTAKSYSRMDMLQVASKENPSYELLFLADIHIDFSLQFLARCRMNAIENKQVYFPIVFSPYKPSEFLQEKILYPFAARFQLNGNRGAWMQKGFHTACLYNHDLVKVLDHGEERVEDQHLSLLEKFEKIENMRIFHAVEPGLIHMWQDGCKEVEAESEEGKLCSRLEHL